MASDVTDAYIEPRILALSDRVDLVDIKTGTTFSDCNASREIPFRLPNDLYPNESCDVDSVRNFYVCRGNDLLWFNCENHVDSSRNFLNDKLSN